MLAIVSAILLIRSAFAAMTAIAFRPNGPAIPIAAKRAAIMYRLAFFARKLKKERQNDVIRICLAGNFCIDFLVHFL